MTPVEVWQSKAFLEYFAKGFILYILMYFLTLLQIVCHGCGFKVESQSTNEEQFTAFDEKMVTVTICEDCKKDLDTQRKGCFMSSLEKTYEADFYLTY